MNDQWLPNLILRALLLCGYSLFLLLHLELISTQHILVICLYLAPLILSYFNFQKNKPQPQRDALKLFLFFLDLAFISFILYKHGGAHNPFTVLYIVISFVAALTLNLPALTFIILTSIALLGGFYSGLLEPHTHTHHQTDMTMETHLRGMWIANSLITVLGSLCLYYLRKLKEKADSKHIKSERVMANLERLDSLGRMAAMASHKINTSLSTIKLSIDEILAEKPKLSDDETQENLEDCLTAIDQISDIIDAIKDDSLSQTQQTNEFIDFKFGLEELVTNWSKPRNAKITCDFSAVNEFEVPSLVIQTLRDVLYALFDNAHEAAIENEKDTIIEINTEAPCSQEIILHIRDFGPGIDKQILSQVFDPLFTTKPKGSGLGLYIVHQSLRKIKASISLKNVEPGLKVSLKLDKNTLKNLSEPS